MKVSIEELENLRQKAIQSIIIGIIITVVLVVVFSIIILNPIFGLVIGGFITFAISYKSIKNFRLAFKEVFVRGAFEKIFNNIVYTPEKGFDRNVIANTAMMYMGDKYDSNDYVSAEYKGIRFEQADINITETRTDSDGDSHTVTLFQGRWMIFDFNKNFKADVQVYSKYFGNATRRNTKSGKFQKIELESAEFNKSFKTYAQSQHDAFYILTPHIMEKIQNLSKNMGNRILLCFVNNKLHVGIQNNKDSFEGSVWTKIDEEKIIEKINSEINVITRFIDELNLDNDLFRKEGI